MPDWQEKNRPWLWARPHGWFESKKVSKKDHKSKKSEKIKPKP